MKGISIEERATNLAHYIIDSKDTVRGAAVKFGISKSTVHKDVTFQNGKKIEQVIPESIEIKGVFLSTNAAITARIRKRIAAIGIPGNPPTANTRLSNCMIPTFPSAS